MTRYIDEYFAPFTFLLTLGLIASLLLYALAIVAIGVGISIAMYSAYKNQDKLSSIIIDFFERIGDLFRKGIVAYGAVALILSIFLSILIITGFLTESLVGVKNADTDIQYLWITGPINVFGVAVFIRYRKRLWGPSIYNTTGISQGSKVGIALEETVRKGLGSSLIIMILICGVAILNAANSLIGIHQSEVSNTAEPVSYILAAGLMSLTFLICFAIYKYKFWGRSIGEAVNEFRSSESIL